MDVIVLKLTKIVYETICFFLVKTTVVFGFLVLCFFFNPKSKHLKLKKSLFIELLSLCEWFQNIPSMEKNSKEK